MNFNLILILLMYSFLSANDNYINSYNHTYVNSKKSNDETVFIREYTYVATSSDTKFSSKIKAIQHLKKILSEEIGTVVETVVESSFEDNNEYINEYFKEEINTLSVSITKLKILKEYWNGSKFYIKAEVRVDEKQTLQLLADAVRGKGKQQEINQLNKILKDRGYQISILDNKINKLKNRNKEQNLKIALILDKSKNKQKKINRLNTQLKNSIPTVKLISNTKVSYLELEKTYAYCKGQELALKRIEEKYPDLRQSIFFIRSKFNSEFSTSLQTITKILSKNKKVFKKLNEKLDEMLKKIILQPKKNLINFIEEIGRRSTGNMESPMIETLLIYNPFYNKYPHREFNNDFKKTFISDGSNKAKGVSFEISVPQSWKSKEAYRPNIVRKFISRNGHGNVMATILVKNTEIDDNIVFNKSGINEYILTDEMIKTVDKSFLLKDYGRFKIENQVGYWQHTNKTYQRGEFQVNIDMLSYYILFNNKMIIIQFFVVINNNISKKKEQQKEFKKYEPLFKQILNSFILTDRYN